MEEFDLEAFNQKYEEAQAENPEDVLDEQVEDTEDMIEDEEVQEEVLEEEDPLDSKDLEEEVEEEEELNPNAPDEQKRNQAFAQLRRERDEAKKFQSFMETLAEQNGITVEQMMANYENAKLQKEADEKGVPVDLLHRMKALEEENAAIKNQTFAERFNSDVEKTIEKYGATEDEVEATFQYIQQEGLVEAVKSGKYSFETLHKLAHIDTLVEKKSTEAVQKNLSNKKKRQKEAPLPNGSSSVDIEDSLEQRAIEDAKRIIANGF